MYRLSDLIERVIEVDFPVLGVNIRKGLAEAIANEVSDKQEQIEELNA